MTEPCAACEARRRANQLAARFTALMRAAGAEGLEETRAANLPMLDEFADAEEAEKVAKHTCEDAAADPALRAKLTAFIAGAIREYGSDPEHAAGQILGQFEAAFGIDLRPAAAWFAVGDEPGPGPDS